jgi:hypothetical protein
MSFIFTAYNTPGSGVKYFCCVLVSMYVIVLNICPDPCHRHKKLMDTVEEIKNKKRENYALSPEFVMIVLTSVSVIS